MVVSRWYGGILLGPDRFKHINNCARSILVERSYVGSPVSSGRHPPSAGAHTDQRACSERSESVCEKTLAWEPGDGFQADSVAASAGLGGDWPPGPSGQTLLGIVEPLGQWPHSPRPRPSRSVTWACLKRLRNPRFLSLPGRPFVPPPFLLEGFCFIFCNCVHFYCF